MEPTSKRQKVDDESTALREENDALKKRLEEAQRVIQELKRGSVFTEKELNDPARVTFRYAPGTCQKIPAIQKEDPILKKDAVLDAIYGEEVPGTVVIDYDYLKGFMRDTFVSYGCTVEDAEISADVLIASDKRGIDSHGIGRLKPIYCERMDAKILKAISTLKFVSQTKTTAVVDGEGGIGLSIGPKCMQIAIDKAKKHGIGMVCVRNSTHYGFAGYYGLMAADQDCIGITGTNARPSIAPTYGVSPMMGTNPLVFGLPSDDAFPFVVDCATSVNQRGKIEKYAREGKSTPPGAVVGIDGKELTDSNEILRLLVEKKCAMTPLGGSGHSMGGYKGYGYAATVEILSAALQGNCWGGALADKYVDKTTGETKRQPSLLGHFFIAIDISAFRDPAEFKRDVSAILRGFRESKKDPNYGGRIYTAGEPEHVAWTHRSNHGGTPVPPALQKQMVELRNAFPSALKQKYSKLPFE